MNRDKSQNILARLKALGVEFKADSENQSKYSRDESVETQGYVAGVCFPTNTSQVQSILRLAQEAGLPVIPRGAGSGLSGAAVPFRESLILSLEKMNRILHLDEKNLCVTVQPGVITADLKKTVEKEKLYYPPLPSSMDFCTIGGNVSTNAGGLCAVKYGVTRKFVLGLEAVLPSGEVIRTGGKFIKHTSGFDLTQLLTGSEGTLAVITEITLSLLPLPSHRSTLLIPFKTMQLCTEFVCRLLQSGQAPATLEMMPQRAITLVQRRHPELTFPAELIHAAYLLIECDGHNEAHTQTALEALADLSEAFAVEPILCDTNQQRESVWNIRRRIREAISREGLFVEADAVVPRDQLTQLVTVGDETSAKFGIEVFSYGHAGDGNLHTYFLPASQNKEAWSAQEYDVLSFYFKKVQTLGGTISGEHGIGALKKDYLSIVFPPHHLHLFQNIKKVFDPKGILNPGKVFPS